MNSLKGSLAHYVHPKGKSLTGRLLDFKEWVEERIEDSHYQYGRELLSAPLPRATIKDLSGHTYQGINLAVQDYLALSTHPTMMDAVKDAFSRYGVHSAGSSALMGNSELSVKLEAELGKKLSMEHVMLFSTGWAAGFGVISGLVRKEDYIVIDQLAHACLQSGAQQTGATTVRFLHNSASSLRERLVSIREKDPNAAVLVVTESLFSMDSDSPDLELMQKIAHEFDATFLVDIAHCLGNCGPNGTGVLGIQNMLGKVDLVIGSFSKTFASNGGFIATNKIEVKHYLQWFASSWTYSNGPTPLQNAIVLNALRIIDSEEGETRRNQLASSVQVLRTELSSLGLDVLGSPSAIVPVVIGRSPLLRTTSRLLTELGVLANMTEFPVVPRNKGRLRLQVMATHSHDEMREAAGLIAKALTEAQSQIVKLGMAT